MDKDEAMGSAKKGLLRRVVALGKPSGTRGGATWPEGVVERVRAWFFGGTPAADAACGVVAAVCAAALLWFFFVSAYGVPAAPVYAGF